MNLSADPVFDLFKIEAMRRGYRFEIDSDGTERMYRPDGTLAFTAIPEDKISREQVTLDDYLKMKTEERVKLAYRDLSQFEPPGK